MLFPGLIFSLCLKALLLSRPPLPQCLCDTWLSLYPHSLPMPRLHVLSPSSLDPQSHRTDPHFFSLSHTTLGRLLYFVTSTVPMTPKYRLQPSVPSKILQDSPRCLKVVLIPQCTDLEHYLFPLPLPSLKSLWTELLCSEISFIYSFNSHLLAAYHVPGTQEHNKGFAPMKLTIHRHVHDIGGQGNGVTLKRGHWSRDLDEAREGVLWITEEEGSRQKEENTKMPWGPKADSENSE